MGWSFKGYKLIELMIVLCIITILVAVALPSYLDIRTTANKNTCIANLKQINSAIEQWGINNDVDEDIELTPYEDEIYGFLHGELPKCPSGGRYVFGRLGTHPQIRCNM